MNVDIAFGGSYVVEVTLGDGGIRNIYFLYAVLAYQNCTMHQGRPLVKVHNTIVCKYCNTFFA
jgi:hypothetical protein